jgi:hypothetical protein
MPGTRSLLETIQSLHQATQMIRSGLVSKSRRLTHVNLLFQNTMKGSILNFQLAKGPTSCDCHREQDANGGWLDNRVEGVFIVKTIVLSEPFRNQSSLISLNRPINMFLHFE